MGSSTALNLFLGASLSQVWSILNTQQSTTRAPLYTNLNFPAITLIVNKILLNIAAFNLVDTKKYLDSHLYFLPEEDPYSQSFELCDYESTLLLENASSTVWMYNFHLAILIVFVGPVLLINKLCKGTLECLKKKIEKYFFWNGLIRLFMETFFELALVAVLNVHTVDWSTPFRAVMYSNVLAVLFLVLLGVLSIFLFVFYCINFKILNEECFQNKYGSGLLSTNTAKKVYPRSILAYPVFFIIRRILFVVSVIYLE